LYKRIVAGAGTTDPSLDTANWTPAMLDGKVNSVILNAIAATLPSVSFVDACFHLAKDDTDKGAWRRIKGQVWRSETRSAGKQLGSFASATAAVAGGGMISDVFYNTTAATFHEITGATTSVVTSRAGREDYPTNALITAEATRVIIWDLDGSVPSMWATRAVASCSKVSALGNTLAYNSGSNGVIYYDFCRAAFSQRTVSGLIQYSGSSFSTTGSASAAVASGAIVNNTVNAVALAILPDAPMGEYGMSIPTIAVATAGGVSEIENDGTVKNSLSTTASYGISYDELNRIRWNTTTEYNCSPVAPRAASFTASSATEPKLSAAAYSTSNVPISPAIATGTGRSVKNAIASTNGLTLYRAGQSSNALHAAVTNTYNTGWLVGDIRRCFLANSKTVDRSIKAGTLVEVGTITETAYAGGRSVYSGFSASNYLQEASHADWNALGAGNFDIILSGVKWGTVATLKTILSIGNGTSAGSLEIEHLAANTLRLSIWSAVPTKTAICTSTAAFTDTAEHTIQIGRGTVVGVADTCYIKVDGIVVASAVSTLTISNATGNLRIGEGQAASQPWGGGQVSCVRISATSPTAEQSKFVSATENALNSGNTCLLSNSASVSALSYDKDTNTLLIGNGTNVDTFVDLKRIASQAHGVTTLTALASVNGRKLIAGTGANYTTPERNVSAELLEQILAPSKPVTKKITSSAGSVLYFPQGWKATHVTSTAGTYISLSTNAIKSDGFLYYLDSGVAASTDYDCELVEM